MSCAPADPRRLPEPAGHGLRRVSGWVIGGALLAGALVFPPPGGLSPGGWRVAGLAGLMAALWICESLPLAATALLPLVLIPGLGLGDIKEAAAPFANPVVFLFLGGFLLAAALQKWNLHRRMALALLGVAGAAPSRIIGACLLSTALVSMWVNNTAAAMMLLPVAVSIAGLVPVGGEGAGGGRQFSAALMLAVAYGATCGGMATLIGTAPNAFVAAYAAGQLDTTLGFARWMVLGVPLAAAALVMAWLVLTRLAFRPDSRPVPEFDRLLREERAALGGWGFGEVAVAVVFLLTVGAWLAEPLLEGFFPMINDSSIALAAAVVLYAVPVPRGKGGFLLDARAFREVPWDILLLFGGGLSLAAAVKAHGLADWMGGLAGGLHGLPAPWLMLLVCVGILALTELNSNTATIAAFLPAVAAVAEGAGESPLLFAIPAALAASCAFMLPVGTPPNAVVFSSGLVRLPDMMRAGLLLNVLLAPLIVLAMWWVGRPVFGLSGPGGAAP